VIGRLVLRLPHNCNQRSGISKLDILAFVVDEGGDLASSGRRQSVRSHGGDGDEMCETIFVDRQTRQQDKAASTATATGDITYRGLTGAS
jgi:hypothetical protein